MLIITVTTLKDMPTDEPAPLSLTNEAGATQAEATGNGVPSTTPMQDPAQILENLKQFVDATHQKAAQVVTWLSNVEAMTGDRANRLLYNNYSALLFNSFAHGPNSLHKQNLIRFIITLAISGLPKT